MNPMPIVLISGQTNLFKEGWTDCGIYALSGLTPSSFEIPIYIGSSKDLRKRIALAHIPELQNNIHCNNILQNYFNENGLINLVVFKLESCAQEKLLSLEQEYINFYGTAKYRKCFNISDKVSVPGSRLGFKNSDAWKKRMSGKNHPMFGKTHSEEARKKISLGHIGKKHTEESKRKISLAGIGRKMSQENIERISGENSPMKRPEIVLKVAKPYKLISPDGEIFEGKNMAEFSRKYGLNAGAISGLMRGIGKTHKKWKKYEE